MSTLLKSRAKSAVRDYTKPYSTEDNPNMTFSLKKDEAPASKESKAPKEEPEEEEGTDEPAAVSGLAEKKKKKEEGIGTGARIASALIAGLGSRVEGLRQNRAIDRQRKIASFKKA